MITYSYNSWMINITKHIMEKRIAYEQFLANRSDQKSLNRCMLWLTVQCYW